MVWFKVRAKVSLDFSFWATTKAKMWPAADWVSLAFRLAGNAAAGHVFGYVVTHIRKCPLLRKRWKYRLYNRLMFYKYLHEFTAQPTLKVEKFDTDWSNVYRGTDIILSVPWKVSRVPISNKISNWSSCWSFADQVSILRSHMFKTIQYSHLYDVLDTLDFRKSGIVTTLLYIKQHNCAYILNKTHGVSSWGFTNMLNAFLFFCAIMQMLVEHKIQIKRGFAHQNIAWQADKLQLWNMLPSEFIPKEFGYKNLPSIIFITHSTSDNSWVFRAAFLHNLLWII